MRRGPVVIAVGLAATGLLLQGCVTAVPAVYGPIGPEAPFGYRDRQNPDGGYTVLVAMPGYATPDALRDFFNRRAGELCTAGVDRTNVFRLTVDDQIYMGYNAYGPSIATRNRSGVELEGYVYCKPGSGASGPTPKGG